VYKYWDYLICLRIPEFYLYFIVAFIILNKAKLMKTPPSNLPQIISSLGINSIDEVDKIVKLYFFNS